MTKYPSRYSPDKEVTAAQYITEIICEKKAHQDNKELPKQYWKLPEWAKYFRNQIPAANKLVKKYPADKIIRALQRIDAKTIYSLRNPYLIKLIEEECRKKIDENVAPPKLAPTNEKPKRFVKETRLGKLKRLQDGL